MMDLYYDCCNNNWRQMFDFFLPFFAIFLFCIFGQNKKRNVGLGYKNKTSIWNFHQLVQFFRMHRFIDICQWATLSAYKTNMLGAAINRIDWYKFKSKIKTEFFLKQNLEKNNWVSVCTEGHPNISFQSDSLTNWCIGQQ